MDTFIPSKSAVRTTQAAEGLPRWRWTTDEFVRLTDLGVFGEQDRFELFGGEIVPTAAGGRRHFMVVEALEKSLLAARLLGVNVLAGRQFNFDESTFTEPDLVLWQGTGTSYDARGPDTLLLIEVADTSLQTDLGFRRRLHAQFGVREYWVVHAWDLSTRVHTNPVGGDYTTVIESTSADMLVPTLMPSLALRLADLNIG